MAKKPEILDLNDQIRSVLTFRIRGISPLVQNRFYNKDGIRNAHAGDRTKNRAPRDPAAECANAAHKLTNGGYGFPADGLKGSVIEAAHVDIGLPKTLLKKSFFIRCLKKTFLKICVSLKTFCFSDVHEVCT